MKGLNFLQRFNKQLCQRLALPFLLAGPLVGDITISPTAPSNDLLASSSAGIRVTGLFPLTGTAPAPIPGSNTHAKGQLFTLGASSTQGFEISSITIQHGAAATYQNDTLTLRVFEGAQADWASGTGHLATDIDFYKDTTVTPLSSEAFTINGNVPASSFVTFELTTPLVVDENSNLGFFLTYDPASGTSPNRVRYSESNGSGALRIITTNHATSPRAMTHFIQGVPSSGAVAPTPTALAAASIFSNGMVLQRGKPVAVWGTASPLANISVSIDGLSASGSADASGQWKVMLPSLSAGGGPKTLAISDGTNSQNFQNVLIGDVWVAAGQSNMARSLNQMTNGAFYAQEILNNNLPIRHLGVNTGAAVTPQETGSMSWGSPSSAIGWTGVGTAFAYNMYQATGVPTAVLRVAWGGSAIKTWMPEQLGESLPYFAAEVADFKANDAATVQDMIDGTIPLNIAFTRDQPTTAYNKMVHPIRHFGVSGFIWYQGEADSNVIENAAKYGFSLPAFATEYRKIFDQGDLPFIAVQLPSFRRPFWPILRESQTQIQAIPNGHLAISLDTGDLNDVHPFEKEPIALRLSLLARKFALGENIIAESPEFLSMAISGNIATLSFDHAEGLTTENSLAPAAFEIAGADQIFYPATSATINGRNVIISAVQVPSPVAVRYAWVPFAKDIVNLENVAGLPAAPFRTDNWDDAGLGAQAPQAVADGYTGVQEQPLIVAATGVLANDIDLNRDPLTAILVTDVSNGTLALQADGAFTYTPNSGFIGTDQFSYQASDGGASSATVTAKIVIEAGQSPYLVWSNAQTWPVGSDRAPTGDPDGDGQINFLEFALGSDPTNTDSLGSPKTSPTPGGVSLQFNNIRDSLFYDVQISTDLVTWSEPPYLTVTSATAMPLILPDSLAVDGKLFIRLRIRN